ncbi:GIY-YIG nuclease family protein [Francisella salimarina]|uniref:GIY-YIG nuclease family protein n=1 Tax=Francisella salimarina TaxID=2599927 RepID=UPI0037503CE8
MLGSGLVDEMSNEKSIIYVLSNEAMPGLIKIGKTTQNSVESRVSQLYTTGVPLPFKCEYAVEVEDCHVVERALHTAFRNNRINPNREFFDIEPDQVIAILKLLDCSLKDVTKDFEDEIEKNTDKIDLKSAEKAASKRPNMNFIEMGIPNNAELSFVDDTSIKVKVIGAKKVSYDGREMSLTMATRIVKELDEKHPIRPAPYWLYNGDKLDSLYEATYEF